MHQWLKWSYILARAHISYSLLPLPSSHLPPFIPLPSLSPSYPFSFYLLPLVTGVRRVTPGNTLKIMLVDEF